MKTEQFVKFAPSKDTAIKVLQKCVKFVQGQ